MFIHDLRHNGKSEADAGFLGGDRRIKNMLADVDRNPRAAVLYADLDRLASASFRIRNLHPQLTTIFSHGFVSILDEVYEYLFAKILVQQRQRKVIRKIPRDPDRSSLP